MRRLTLLSGSKLLLASYCAWWAQPEVPQVDVGPNEERAVGTATHRCIQNFVTTGEADVGGVVSCLQEKEARLVANLYNAWWTAYSDTINSAARAEVTYAFDVETCSVRELGVNLERRYEEAGLRPSEIPVTVDLDFAEEGVVYVYDWKTGSQRHREDIESHKQLRAGGYCAARVAGADCARIIVSYLDEDGVQEYAATLTDFDFPAIEEELVERHRAVLSSPRPQPGPHCADLWCSAVASCPAVQRAREEVEAGAASPSSSLVVSNAAAIRSKEQAAKMYVLLSQYDAYSEACWRALKAYVDVHGPVPLGDGSAYTSREGSRESIRLSDSAAAVVREMLGPKADEAIKMSITKESIKDATMALVGGGRQRTALERELMARLEQLGAVRTSTYVSYETTKLREPVATED